MPSNSQGKQSSSGADWQANPVVFIGLLAVAYFVAARLGLLFVARPEGLAAIWPASGVALAGLLLSKRSRWPGILGMIFIINALTNLVAGNSLVISVGFAFANTLEPAVGGWLMVRLCGERVTFERLTDVLGLIITAVLANGLTALVGALVPTLGSGASYGSVWLVWWLSDGLGILAVTPFVVTWLTHKESPFAASLRSRVEIVLWMAALCISTWFMFGASGVNIRLEPRPYMLFPVLIWGVLRFSPRASATALMFVSIISLGCTAAGWGMFPLGGENTTERLIAVQGFCSVASMTIMMLAATLADGGQANQAVKQSEQRFRALIEKSADAITLLSAEGKVLYEGPMVERMTGYAPQDRLGKSTFSNVFPEDLPLVRTKLAHVFASPGSSQDAQFRSVRKDGSIWWTDATATNLLDDPSVQAVVVNYRDITSRKQAEIALQEQELWLRESQRVAHVGTYRLDVLKGEWQSTSTLDEIFGIDQTYPKNIAGWVGIIHPAQQAEMLAYFQNEVIGARAGFDKEYRIIRQADQQVCWVYGRGELLYDAQGNPVAMIGTISDITQRKQSETEREKLLAELERKNKELESIVYIASHDLRSPLVNIQGFGRNLQKYFYQISTLLENAPSFDIFRSDVQMLLTERIPNALRFVETSSAKMDTLIDALLRVSRLGRATLQIAEVDMTALVQTILDSMAFQMDKAHAQVDLQMPLAACRGDKNLLNQVFSNLLDNALKYRDPSRPLTITIRSHLADNKAIYTVADSGLGIAPENQEKIWEIFRRLEDDASIPGEGLGLTIARRIIERHNGSIWVESQPGVGSQFFIALPVQ
jgi:PAS domain S-box-containing protein